MGLALSLLCGLLAATDAAEPTIKAAEQSLKALDFQAAAAGFEKACAAQICSRPQLLRTQVGLATALSSLGQSAKAVEAFKRLLFIAPDWQLPQGASPRLREPLDAAQVFWRSRARPEIEVRVGEPAPQQALGVTVKLLSDPLAQVARLRVVLHHEERDQALSSSAERVAGSDGGFSERFELPWAPGGRWVFVAQALSASGSVLLETERVERQAPRVEPSAPVVTVEPQAPPPASRALLHVSASALVDALTTRLGAELRLGVSPAAVFDIDAGVVLGEHVGIRLLGALHLPRTYRFSPQLQLRMALHPTAAFAIGGGLALGGTVELGPGRLFATAAAELYRAAPQFKPFSVLLSLGYEVDLPGLRSRTD